MPYLSIVCALGPRQRDEKWLRQTRLFLATLTTQAARYALPIEILIGDAGSAETALATLLGPVDGHDFATIRFIDLSHADWQGERRAQNCAIRRADGQFILATGVEVILSDVLFAHLATRPLAPRSFYYGFRFDTAPASLENANDLTAIESACRRGVYSAGPSIVKVTCDGSVVASDADWESLTKQAAADAEVDQQILPIAYSMGNFLLMARENWLEIGGFPEWNVADRHFDRIVMGQAHYRGWAKSVFTPTQHYFSVSRLRELDLSQDFYTDKHGDLRIRVESPPMRPFGDYHVMNVLHRLKITFDKLPALLPARIETNDSGWGLPGQDLPEHRLQSSTQNQLA